MTPLIDAKLQALVSQAQEGDTAAFEKVYDHFFDQIYRYCSFRVPDEIAEDLTSDIFVKAWEKLHTYKARKNVPFSAWLFRIAKNIIVDAYRTYKNYEEVSEEIIDPDGMNRAEARTERKYLLRTVRRALDQLPKRHQDVLTLSYFGGLPNREVAEVLRMSEGAVRILKLRALKKLESALPEHVHDELLLSQPQSA